MTNRDGNRDGNPTPYQKAGFNGLTLFWVINDDQYDLGEIVWLMEDDETSVPEFSNGSENYYCIIPYQPEPDLEELPKDADGFYLWDGGECPVPGDWRIDGQDNVSTFMGRPAATINWAKVTRFRPHSRPDMPSMSRCTFSEQEDIGVHFSPTFNKNEHEEIVNKREVFIPEDLWNHRRKETLKDVIKESLSKGTDIPVEWVVEYNKLVEDRGDRNDDGRAN